MTSAESDLPPRANLTPRDVSRFLAVSLSTIYDMIGENRLPAVKLKKVIRIPRAEFLKWFNSHIQTGESGRE